MFKHHTISLSRFFGRLRALGLILSAAASTNVSAQVVDSTAALPTFDLPAVTVHAARIAINRLDAPTSVVVLDSSAFRFGSSQSVADVLARSSAVFVREYGPGGITSVSARGSSSYQSTVLLDGLPLVNPALGQFDLSILPRSAIASAEVRSGVGSAEYGSAAVGSVIDLTTRRGLSDETASIELRTGSFGEQGANAHLSRQIGSVRAYVSVGHATSDGDFRFRNTAAFPQRFEDRRNADARRTSLLASVAGGSRASGQTSASLLIASAERGLPGVATVASVGERQFDEIARLSARKSVRSRGVETTVRGFVDRASLRYVNPELALDETGITSGAMVEAEQKRLVHGALLNVGTSVTGRTATHPSLDAVRRSLSASAFASAAIQRGRTTWYPALRTDVYGREGVPTIVVPSPQLGLNHRVGRRIRIKASGGRAFRVPTFNDLYWSEGGATGNADLRPERGWGGDAGVLIAGPVDAEVSAFGTIVRNQIVWTPADNNVWTPINVGQVRSRGIEASVHHREIHIGGLSLVTTGRYTFTDAREIVDGGSTGVRYVPRHRFAGTLAAAVGIVTVETASSVVSSRLVTTDGLQSVAPYAPLDVTIRADKRWGDYRLSAFASILNVLDEEYSVVKGYPMPPRNYHFGIRLELGS